MESDPIYVFNRLVHKLDEFVPLNSRDGRSAVGLYGTPEGSHFGSALTLNALYDVESRWYYSGETQKIELGNISLEGGGHPDHRSHKNGMDADIRPIRTGGEGMLTWKSNNYDQAATQRLVDQLLATNKVEFIFFNDPKIQGVRPYPLHDNHLHVRFK